MADNIKTIIDSMSKGEKKYFVDSNNNIRESTGVLSDVKTDFYIDEKGRYMEKSPGFQNKYTGFYQDEDGDIRTDGMWSDTKTGNFIDEKGKHKKEGAWGKEGFWGSDKKTQKTQSNYSLASSSGGDDMSFVFWAVKWTFVLGIIAVALYIAAIAAAFILLLGPIILLSWYLIKKRNLKWQPIVGMILSAYFAYDFSFGGYITQLVGGFSAGLPLKYFGLLYAVILAVLIGLYLDKMSFIKYPSVSNTNFITKKEPKARRPFIGGVSGLIVLSFVGFSFINLNSFDSPSQMNQYGSSETVISNDVTSEVTAIINGSNVVIRSNPSTTAKKIGSFKNTGERVRIVNTYADNNKHSGIIRNDFNLNNYVLKKGKAVQITSYNGTNVNISYQDENNRYKNTTVPLAIVEDTDKQKWYQVQRSNGELGWVFGKFVSVLSNPKQKMAVISDADGYTNLRSEKGTKSSIVKRILSNEKFLVIPSNEKWWKVETQDNNSGYIFHNRVDILDTTFYVTCVTVTNTETQALKEVKKLENQGYAASHLWIPNYASLSGAKKYLVYIGPQTSQSQCEIATEKYRQVDPKAYGLMVAQKNKRVEIRGKGYIKVINQ